MIDPNRRAPLALLKLAVPLPRLPVRRVVREGVQVRRAPEVVHRQQRVVGGVRGAGPGGVAEAVEGGGGGEEAVVAGVEVRADVARARGEEAEGVGEADAEVQGDEAGGGEAGGEVGGGRRGRGEDGGGAHGEGGVGGVGEGEGRGLARGESEGGVDCGGDGVEEEEEGREEGVAGKDEGEEALEEGADEEEGAEGEGVFEHLRVC